MAKFKFELEAGVFVRKQVRLELQRSKDKLEYAYSGGRVNITEEKGIMDSTFYVQGTGFPDTDEFEKVIRDWEIKIKQVCNEKIITKFNEFKYK
jgi:hypothetical protein